MTTRLTGTAIAAAILLTASNVTAQASASLVGLTRFTNTLQQSLHTPCTLLPSCPAPGLPPATSPTAGGTAFDGSNNNMWATSGQALASYSGPITCTLVCPPGPCPKSSPAANASGLDVVESLGELWITDDLGWLTRCNNVCPPTISAQCPITMLPGDIPTGVAVDDGRGLVFYTALNATGSRLYIAQIATPCTPFANVPLLDCFSFAIPSAGIAVDWGNAIVYWTDGRGTYSFTYTYNSSGPSITFGAQTCCIIVSPNDPYTDLTLRPRGVSPAGNPCANGTCPVCPNIHTLRNAPILGSTVEFGLDNAPEAALAICALAIGSCTAGAPTIPPLCGPLLLPGPPSSLPFQITTGSSGCAGSATFLWPLPAIPAFAGLPIASQVIVICGAGTGTALSNCIDFTLLAI